MEMDIKDKGDSRKFLRIVRYFMGNEPAFSLCERRRAELSAAGVKHGRLHSSQLGNWFRDPNPGLLRRGVETAFVLLPKLKQLMGDKVTFLPGLHGYVLLTAKGRNIYDKMEAAQELPPLQSLSGRIVRTVTSMVPAAAVPTSRTTRRQRDLHHAPKVQLVRTAVDLDSHYGPLRDLMQTHSDALDPLVRCVRQLEENYPPEAVAEIFGLAATFAESCINNPHRMGDILRVFAKTP